MGKLWKYDIKFFRFGNAGAPGALALLLEKWCYRHTAASVRNPQSRATSAENTPTVMVWCNWWGITDSNKARKNGLKCIDASQRLKWSVNHKPYSVPITSRIPWHCRTPIVLVGMKHDLNRNAIQSAETQNKSTGKQYKASYIVSHSNPRPRTWPEKNQLQHIPIRPLIYCVSKSLYRDDKLTVHFPKGITPGMQFGKHSRVNVACCKFLLESKFCKNSI